MLQLLHLFLFLQLDTLLCVCAEEVLPELSRAVGAGAVYCHGEVTVEEANVEAAVKKALDKSGAALKVGF